MLTWAYWYPDRMPDRITIDGAEYEKLHRLPRNVREGDAISLFDGIHRDRPYQTFAIVTGVDYWRKEIKGWRVSEAVAQISYRIAPGQLYGYVFESSIWRPHRLVMRGNKTREPFEIWRKRAR